MEQALQSRLVLRHKRLIELTNKARAMFDGNISIPLVQVTQLCLQLKIAIKAMDKEALLFAEKCGDKEGLASQCTEDQMRAEDALASVESLSQVAVDRTPEQVSRLPKLDLAKFNGDILKWTEFWDKFEANIDCRNLKDVDKLAYLLSSLEGAALATVEGLGATNANYSIAVDVLRKRYGAKDKVVDAHYGAINKLEVAANMASVCRQNLNQVEKHLRILAAHGENVDSNHLRVTISSKFPSPVLYQVRLLSKDTTITELRGCLEKVITAMEQSDLPTPSFSTSSVTIPETSTSTEVLHSVTKQPLRRFNRPKRRQEPRRVNFTWDRKRKANTQEGPESKRPRSKCVFCGQGHFSNQCEKYATSKERIEKLGNKCYICFREGHRATKCFKAARTKCYHCKRQHNTALCDKKFAVAQNGNGSTSTQQ